jgi:uncharacterized coiled-coil DUF342 family protein
LNEDIRNLTSNDVNNAAREQLRSKISSLKAEKEKIRAQKEPIFQKLTSTQEALKAKVDDLHTSKDKVQFKKPEDIDRKIQQLEEQIESGSLKLIDEKKTVAEISKLRKIRRELESFSGQESSIADLKKAADHCRSIIAERDRELRALDEQMKTVNAELDKLSSSRNENQSKIKALINQRDATRKQLDGLYEKKSAAYEDLQKAQAAHRIWMQAEQVKWEESQVQRDIERAIRDLELEMKKLEMPACSDQIEQCLNLQTYLRTNVLKESVPVSSDANSILPNAAGRQVEKLMEAEVFKKQNVEDNYSINSKKSKSKKGTGTAALSNNVKLPFWVISALSELKVNMVFNAEEAKLAIDALEGIKKSCEQTQAAQLANIDSERAAIQARIDKQKERIPKISEEAAARMKAKKAAKLETDKSAPVESAKIEA